MNQQKEIIQSVWEAEITRMKELEKRAGNIVFDLSYLNSPFFVQYELKSKNSELGLFANQDIKTGEIVCLLPIRFIPTSLEKISLEIAPNHFVDWYTDIHPGNWYSSPDGDYCECCFTADFINHACYPDCNVYSLSNLKNMTEELIAINDIKAGEEILIDYDTFLYMDDPMKCLCNSSQCRQEIKGFKYLTEATKQLFWQNNLISIAFAADIYSNLPDNERNDFALFYKNCLSAEEKIYFDILVDVIAQKKIIIV